MSQNEQLPSDSNSNPQKILLPNGFKPGTLMGRLANGFERDAGTLVHLVPSDFAQYQSTGKARCGQKPGRSSGGWDVEHCANASPTCTRCMPKQQKSPT